MRTLLVRKAHDRLDHVLDLIAGQKRDHGNRKSRRRSGTSTKKNTSWKIPERRDWATGEARLFRKDRSS